MDGNGRWAAQRGLPRGEGHRRGVEALRRTVRAAGELGIQILTIFSFSSENWSRPKQEILDLMGLLRRFIRHDLAELHSNNVRVRIIGARSGLGKRNPPPARRGRGTHKEQHWPVAGRRVQLWRRQEIARAARRIAEDVAAGRLNPEDVTVDLLSSKLDTAGIPDPDLIIRTSGEQRLSNFLLVAGSLQRTGVRAGLLAGLRSRRARSAIAEYRRRERRFGGLVARTGS